MITTDERHMRHALTLAARGLGRTGRVPSVGCVIVAPDGRILAAARTDEGGRPHAEAAALMQTGDAARGATVYVSLEPCAHISHSGPPCADALVRAGVARVVVAMTDPDPRTNGKGIARLRDAGIEVTSDILRKDAEALNRGFTLRITDTRPFVTVKLAQSADGFTARVPGESPWITGGEARCFGQLLRAQHDAILVGIETVLADDPELTCRVPGLEKYSPLRVVLDSKLRLPVNSKLAQTARQIPTLVFTAREGGDALRALGVEVLMLNPDTNGHVPLTAVLKALAERDVMRLLVEGGATIANTFYRAGFADRLEIFTAPMSLGNTGRHGSGALTVRNLREAPNFMRVSSRSFGADQLETFEVRS
ncbi:MAG TPA: bifunctional diaminohydroxyphosphoribosylaminopyrimidine deaminase/5-amino-6-(5-phosphoribosylamino)uracil reductase RibD [Rhizomicrobium sp.]